VTELTKPHTCSFNHSSMLISYLRCTCKIGQTHWFSYLWSLDVALCYMRTSLVGGQRAGTRWQPRASSGGG